MAVFFWILSVLCLIYYGVIVIYSGLETAFSLVWVVMALCLAAMAGLAGLYARVRDRVPLCVAVSAVTIPSAFFVIFIIVEVLIGLSFLSSGKQSADYVIVLGAQVHGDRLSRTLEYRLEKALAYAELHSNTVFVLSGGRGPGENISEAEAMYRYLSERGVPEYQLIKEEQSRSTYENLVYSKLAITEREKERRGFIRHVMAEAGYLMPPDEETVIHVAIVTSNFHIFRARGIARKIGLTDNSGIAARSDPVLFLHFCVRECFAILKDKFMGNM